MKKIIDKCLSTILSTKFLDIINWNYANTMVISCNIQTSNSYPLTSCAVVTWHPVFISTTTTTTTSSCEGSHNTWYFWRGWGSWIFEKSMKTPSMYWGITIFSNFDVRVGEKRQFLSDSKKHEFWSKMGWKCLVL